MVSMPGGDAGEAREIIFRKPHCGSHRAEEWVEVEVLPKPKGVVSARPLLQALASL